MIQPLFAYVLQPSSKHVEYRNLRSNKSLFGVYSRLKKMSSNDNNNNNNNNNNLVFYAQSTIAVMSGRNRVMKSQDLKGLRLTHPLFVCVLQLCPRVD